MGFFKAGTQYGDCKGTSSADDADGTHDLHNYMKTKGLVTDSEFIIASELWVGENHGGGLGRVGVTVYLLDKPDHASVKVALDSISDPIPVRTVKLEVTLEEYLGFFKRFNVMLTRKESQ